MIFTTTSSSTTSTSTTMLPAATSSHGGVVHARNKQMQPSSNKNPATLVLPFLSTAAATNNSNNDQDEKYQKGTAARTRRVVIRRNNGKNNSIRDSVPKMLGVTALFCTVLLLWHCGKNSIQQRRYEYMLQQRQRASAVLQDRLKHMPHYETEGDGRVAPPNTAVGARAGRLNSAQRQVAGGAENGDQQVLWHKEFEKVRLSGQPVDKTLLLNWLYQHDLEIRNNHAGGVRWIRPYLLPPIEGYQQPPAQSIQPLDKRSRKTFFDVQRQGARMKWEDEWEQMKASVNGDVSKLGPAVDYTDKSKYSYPKISSTPPPADQYPPLRPLKDLILNWPQDQDFPGHIQESLMHFNYSDVAERAMAQNFRDNEIPFKFYDVPEVDAATLQWTDEYVSAGFQGRGNSFKDMMGLANPFDRSASKMPRVNGGAQESADNYFAFFSKFNWEPTTMGLAPVRDNDWDFAKYAEHARYADSKRLSFDQPHFYWQSGVDREERHKDYSRWTFISRDLPSFSSPNKTFFVFHPELQKGIQCRFGERGVVAATHYDGGRNHVAMITGAKRYILSPPRECSNLGIFTHRKSAIYRHSLLNFGHIKYLQDDADIDDTKVNGGMTDEERAWLEKAGNAQALETVLKAGEVLYIPSHWFHYIISLQKSAQCNVRAGIDTEGHAEFGNRATVERCEPWPKQQSAVQ